MEKADADIVSQMDRVKKHSGISGSAGKEFYEFGLNLALPCAADPERFNGSFNVNKTAVGAAFDRLEVPFVKAAAMPTTYNQMSNEDAVIFNFRNAQRNYVYFDPNSAVQNYQYGLYGMSSSGSSSTNSFLPPAPSPNFNLVFTRVGEVLPLRFVYGVSETNYAPHGPVFFAGSDGGQSTRRYFWIDTGCSFTLVNPTWTGAGSMTLQLTQLTAEGPIEHAQSAAIATSGVNVAVVITNAGYYSFEVVYGVSPVSNFVTTAKIGALSGSVWCHRSIPDLANNYQNVEAMRVNGSSIMFFNQCVEGLRSGKVCYAQRSGRAWTEEIATGFNGFLGSRDVTEMLADNGAFAFLKPVGPEDFKLTEHLRVINSKIYDSSYPIFPASNDTNGGTYSLIWVRMPYTTNGGTATSQVGQYTICTSFEYTTTNQWSTARKPRVSAEICMQAIEWLATVPALHENPKHFMEVVRSILSGAKKHGGALANFAIDQGPRIAEFGSKLLPLLAML